MAKLLFEDGRVQIETGGGCAIWLDEGEALMVAHLLSERLAVRSPANPTITYERGFGPGDGDGHVIYCDERGYHAK